jgi:hypothetical protein
MGNKDIDKVIHAVRCVVDVNDSQDKGLSLLMGKAVEEIKAQAREEATNECLEALRNIQGGMWGDDSELWGALEAIRKLKTKE